MTKKKIIIASTILLVAALGAAYYFVFVRSADRAENVVDYNPPTTDQIDAGNKAKEEFLDRTDDTKDNSQNDTTNSRAVSLQISSLNQTDNLLKVRTIVQDTATGSCVLTMSRSGSDSVTKTAETQNMGSYSVCKGFDVDISGLGKGEWSVKIEYTATDGSKTSAEKQVTIK